MLVAQQRGEAVAPPPLLPMPDLVRPEREDVADHREAVRMEAPTDTFRQSAIPERQDNPGGADLPVGNLGEEDAGPP